MRNETVLLINFGGPRTEMEIPSFLRRLMGREPSPAIKESAVDRYRAIGGFSPLPAVTDTIATLIASRLGSEISVRTAFMYSDPTIGDTLMECRVNEVEKILFLILSPFYSKRVVGAYIKCVEDYLAGGGTYKPVTKFLHSWGTEPLFVEWWAEQVHRAAESAPDAFVLFSAHNLPIGESEDLYRSQIENTVRLVAEKSGLASYTLAWQSAPPHSDEKWPTPSVEQVLDSLATRGVNQVIQVPIGFIMDHLETCYDIDILHRQHSRSLGIDHQRLACPNTDPAFVDLLGKLVSQSLKERL